MPFVAYRVRNKIHLGGIEEYLSPGEIIHYDGKKVRRDEGDEISLMYPSALKGAIKAGWLIEATSDVTAPAPPRPAGVEVHSAVSTSEKREKVVVLTVAEEEKDVGSIGAVRTAANDGRGEVPATHIARDSGKTSMPVLQGDDADGVVVGKIGRSPIAEPVEVGKGDLKARSQADTRKAYPVEREATPVRSATGDVQEARSGDHLAELLPDAASSGTPAFTNDGVVVEKTGSSIGGVEEGQVVGRVGASPGPAPTDAEGALRAFVDGGPAPHPSHLKGLLRTFLRKYDAAVAQASVIAEDKAAENVSPEPVPEGGLAWDLERHWKVRVNDALRDHGDNPNALGQIMAVEKSAGVKKALQKRLDALNV